MEQIFCDLSRNAVVNISLQVASCNTASRRLRVISRSFIFPLGFGRIRGWNLIVFSFDFKALERVEHYTRLYSTAQQNLFCRKVWTLDVTMFFFFTFCFVGEEREKERNRSLKQRRLVPRKPERLSQRQTSPMKQATRERHQVLFNVTTLLKLRMPLTHQGLLPFQVPSHPRPPKSGKRLAPR